MNTFIDIVVAILTERSEIPGLRNQTLVALGTTDTPGTPVAQEIQSSEFLKLVRLYTLIQQEKERSVPASFGELRTQSKAFGTNLAADMIQNLEVNEDVERRIMMLERLMIEIVRKNVSSECERLGVEYYIDMHQGLMWRLSQRDQFFRP